MAANTIAGDLEQIIGPARITGVGYAALDGWQDVLKFPGTQLPGGNGTYTFVVMGVIGNPKWRAPYTPTLAKMELGLGLAGSPGVFGAFKFTCNLWDFENAGQTDAPGIPFCFILDATSDASALNNTSASLMIKARIEGQLQKAADPKVIPLGAPSFDVMSATIMVWDRVVLSGADSRFDSVDVNRLTTGYIGNWDGLGNTPTNFGATGEDWLVFHSLQYQPAGAAGVDWHASHFRMDRVPVSGATADVFGFAQTTARIPSGTGFHGTGPRGKGLGVSGAGLADMHNLHHHGGFHISTNVPDAFRFFLYMRQEHSNTGVFLNLFSYVYRWRIFGVRLSALSYVNSYDRTTLQTGDPTQLRFPYWDQVRSLTEEREFSNGDWSDYTMLATATRRVKTQARPGYHLDLMASEAQGDMQVTKSPAVNARLREGIPLLTVGRVPTFRPQANEATLDLSLWKQETAPSVRQDFIADDASWIGFYFETDPENLAFGQQTRGGEVALVPDGEADATSLPTWPVLETNSWSEEQELPLDELRTPLGYRITWPRFLIPREGKRTWNWRGMTKAERDTMQTFIEDNAATAIRHQGPDDTADRIYVLVSPFSWVEVPGGLFNAQVSGVQLVYGTNITPRILT